MTATLAPAARAGTALPDRQKEVPARAAGVELIGELPGSGYKAPPALVRRLDGQTVQLTRLLYCVLEQVDGRRGYDELADAVSRAFGRLVTADQVATLVATKLRPLGVMTLADGSQPSPRKANPLLAVRFRCVVSDPRVTRRITAPFAILFHPAVAVPFTLAFVAVSGWVLFREGLAAATRDAFTQPGLFLLVFAVTVLSAGFHEFGHAAACRYGGATPGAMGAGLYLVWPAFYTEVSDSYRLGRGGRVRVDFGGLYFNAVFAVAMFGVWAATGWEAMLLVIGAQVLQMLRQLAPLVRFDGYHILADLTGVPDLYSHIKPTLAGLLPTRWRTPSALTWWARTIVSVWVLIVVPLLLVSLVMMVVALPRAIGTAWASLGDQVDALQVAWAGGAASIVGVRLLSILAIALPVLGMIYLLVRVLRRTTRSVWRSTRGHPARRTLAGVVALAMLAGLAWAWWPDEGRYRPIGPHERGTIVDAVPASVGQSVSFMEPAVSALSVSAVPQPGAPAMPAVPTLQQGQRGETQGLWAGDQKPPPPQEPQLALVLIPSQSTPPAPSGAPTPTQEPSPESSAAVSSGTTAPTWVFPFDKPDAPGAGDNQALAVNTTDGSTLYDVAFALVWATGDQVSNKNEAYALASCTACTTIAVGFQVVLVIGQANVIVPQNLSAAINYGCIQCLTYSLAQQLVLTLDGPLSDAGTDAIEAVWSQIEAFGKTIQNVPADQIQPTLASYEQQILAIIAAETPTPSSSAPLSNAPTTSSPSGGTAGSSSPSDTGSASPSASPTDSPTESPSAAPLPTEQPTASEMSSADPTASPSPSTTDSGSVTATP